MTQSHRPTAEAFERLCAPYSGMVYRHCLHMLGNPHEAEDAAQESMLRAFRAFDAFRGDAVASWLFRIAHNTCLDILKSARVRRESLTLDTFTGSSVSSNNIIRMLNALMEYHGTDEYFSAE